MGARGSVCLRGSLPFLGVYTAPWPSHDPPREAA